jgi:tRNA-binding protein
METVGFNDFLRLDLRAGTVTSVERFPQARKPAYRIWADFGPDIGVLGTSAQITALYEPAELVGRQILGVVNIPPKQVAGFTSGFLLTGFVLEDGAVVLAQPERRVPDGSRLA